MGHLYHMAVFAASSHAFFAISGPVVETLEIRVAMRARAIQQS